MTKLRSKDRLVLKNIVENFIVGGKPVGSKLVADKLGGRISSATVRNVMALLTEQGYLIQPHVSAGRVPTEKAFHYYVEQLLDPYRLSNRDKSNFAEIMDETPEKDLGDVLAAISKALSLHTSFIALVKTPSVDEAKISELKFVRLAHNKILLVFQTEYDKVFTTVVDSAEHFSASEVNRINLYLNEILDGLTLGEVRVKIVEQMKNEQVMYDRMFAWALMVSDNFLADSVEDEVIIEGKSNIFLDGQFTDSRKMLSIFRAFEQKRKLLNLFDRATGAKGAQVFFCSDHPEIGFEGFSLISAPFFGNVYGEGAIGVLGPTNRLHYAKTIELVDYSASVLHLFLEGKEQIR